MSKIGMKFSFIEGVFDMNTNELICVSKDKYKDVHLCFKGNINVTFAEIKLSDTDKFVDKSATFEDTTKLGEEICRRFNNYNVKAQTNMHLKQGDSASGDE